jgi:hypothetical protein
MTDTNNDTRFPKKLLALLSDDFIETTAAMKNDELKKVVFEAESNIWTIEKAKNNDEELLKAKEHAKELAAPYKEATACQSAKSKYCLFLLEGRGVSLDTRDASNE